MAELIPPISRISPLKEGLEIEKNPISLPENPFEAVLQKAVDALTGISETEYTANRLIDEYVAGRAQLSEVMIAVSKMGITVQLAVTTITTAVNTFKEITQMPM